MPKCCHQVIITSKCLISILYIKSLSQVTPMYALESMHLHQSPWPHLLNASDPLSPPYMKSPKVMTISCHHELHKPSSTNTLASIQVPTQRSLQDASALHVVRMPHRLLTTPSKSMAFLHKSVQPLHRLISISLHVTLAHPSAQHPCLGTPHWMPISDTSTSAHASCSCIRLPCSMSPTWCPWLSCPCSPTK